MIRPDRQVIPLSSHKSPCVCLQYHSTQLVQTDPCISHIPCISLQHINSRIPTDLKTSQPNSKYQSFLSDKSINTAVFHLLLFMQMNFHGTFAFSHFQLYKATILCFSSISVFIYICNKSSIPVQVIAPFDSRFINIYEPSLES